MSARIKRNIGSYLLLTIFSLISIFPLYWMLISSTNKSIDVITGSLLPGSYLWENFKNLLQSSEIKIAFTNSVVFTVLGTLFNVLVCSLAGYGFEIYRDKVKTKLLSILLLSMMIPPAATLIPLFQMFGDLKLLNTGIGYILPTISTAFMIFLFRQSAQSFPRETIEAARIDGLSELGIFFRIFMPMMKSTYAAAITVSFMAIWNSFLWPLVVLQDKSKITMPILLSNLLDVYVVDFGSLMLAVSISSLPTIIIFFFLQKSFARGLTGAIK